MYVMVDVVANHVGPRMPISDMKPFNDSKYYHAPCVMKDMNNQTQVE